jgi:hypothetical protein
MQKKSIKSFDILEMENYEEKGKHYVTGYANIKDVADSYGDIPHSLNGSPVYDLSRFSLNPVALVDHVKSVGNIFGVFIVGPGATYEDSRGLRFKLRLMDEPQTDIAKHAVEAYKSGMARAFSIGGEWAFNDPKNKDHLTTAIIHEISGVAIGADKFALSDLPYIKSIEHEKDESDNCRAKALEMLIQEYRQKPCDLILKGIETLKGVIDEH